MNHQDKQSNVAIIGIIALVGIVGVVLGSFYYYKHHGPIERPVHHMPSPIVPAQEIPAPEPTHLPVEGQVTHIIERPVARPVERITRIVDYVEPEEHIAPQPIERPERKERRPVNISLNLGFKKVVAAPQGEWCVHEEHGAQSCQPCPRTGANKMRRCNSPQQIRTGSWTADHTRVVNLMNQFVNQVLDRNNNAARNTLERAKQIVRSMHKFGANVQATNQNGATLYSVVQQVLVAIAGRLPSNMQQSLNELNSLLR